MRTSVSSAFWTVWRTTPNRTADGLDGGLGARLVGARQLDLIEPMLEAQRAGAAILLDRRAEMQRALAQRAVDDRDARRKPGVPLAAGLHRCRRLGRAEGVMQLGGGQKDRGRQHGAERPRYDPRQSDRRSIAAQGHVRRLPSGRPVDRSGSLRLSLRDDGLEDVPALEELQGPIQLWVGLVWSGHRGVVLRPSLLVRFLGAVVGRVLEVTREIALADRIRRVDDPGPGPAPGPVAAATCCGSITMSGVMPVAWIERPLGVK
jgi:hypothetical protein